MDIPWDIGLKLVVPFSTAMSNNLFVNCMPKCLQNL